MPIISIPAINAVLPMFFELGATIFYTSRRQERRDACHNPALLPRGKLSPPKGCGYFTLAYYLLSRKPMTGPRLVNKIHLLYILCGPAAVLLAFLP